MVVEDKLAKTYQVVGNPRSCLELIGGVGAILSYNKLLSVF